LGQNRKAGANKTSIICSSTILPPALIRRFHHLIGASERSRALAKRCGEWFGYTGEQQRRTTSQRRNQGAGKGAENREEMSVLPMSEK
jgi:hypothetical protein